MSASPRGSPRRESPRRERSPPRERSSPREEKRSGGGGGRPQEERKKGQSLLVRNLDRGTTTDTLKDVFGKFGEVKDVYIPRNHQTREPKGFAFVEVEIQ